MNLRALILTVLMATWMVPSNGTSCLTDSTTAVGHGHEHGAHAGSQPSEERSHDHADQADHAAGQGARRLQHAEIEVAAAATSHAHALSSCCESERETPAVDTAVKNAEPRPESATAVLQPIVTTIAPRVRLAGAAESRRQPPPPLPYEKSRRPLLI